MGATAKANKRSSEIAKLKRDIAGIGVSGSGDDDSKKRKKGSVLEEQRASYASRVRVKAVGRDEKRKVAEELMMNLRSFQERVRGASRPVPDAHDGGEEGESRKTEAAP